MTNQVKLTCEPNSSKTLQFNSFALSPSQSNKGFEKFNQLFEESDPSSENVNYLNKQNCLTNQSKGTQLDNKIQELETRLYKANSIIKDLKIKLKSKQDKFSEENYNLSKEKSESRQFDKELMLKKQTEYHQVITDQQKVIDDLRSEKDDINNQLNKMTQKFNELSDQNQKQMEMIVQKHQLLMKNNKEAWIAGDRIKKEKWI